MGSITLNNVDKVYDNGFHAVNQLSLEVAEGEFLVLVGTFAVNKTAAVIATVGIVLAAFYILWMYQRSMTGEPSNEVSATVNDMTTRERIAIAPQEKPFERTRFHRTAPTDDRDRIDAEHHSLG